MGKRPRISAQEAQAIIIRAITYLATTPEELSLFLGYSGSTPEDLRGQLQTPAFQAGLLDFLLEHETILLNFAIAENLKPQEIIAARLALPGAEQDFKDRCLVNNS
jgi:hypothetical protein